MQNPGVRSTSPLGLPAKKKTKIRAQAFVRSALWSCKTRAILVFIARTVDVGWSQAEVKSEQAAMQTPMSISTMAPTLPQ
jgi:hypothetical protein